jgi:hypothetical protein
MDGGFDRSLENFQIKGNLTVVPDSVTDIGGNGSIEASGTLYVNTIDGYDPEEDLIIRSAVFADNTIYIPHSIGSSAPSVGALVINGGVSITTTANAQNVSSGGSITTLGGVSIGKNLYIGGDSYFLRGADMNGYRITSVDLPIAGTDAVNKDYLDSVAGRVSGDFSPGEVLLGLGEGEGAFGTHLLSFNSTSGQLEIGSGSSGSLFVSSYDPQSILSFGGIDIAGNGSFRSGLNMHSTGITNLTDPTNLQDAATKNYVDQFTGDIRGTFGSTQLLFGLTDNSRGTGSVLGSEQLTYNFSTGSLTLGTLGSLILENTAGNTIQLAGGAQISGNVSLGGDMSLGGDITLDDGMITGLRLATDPTDAASKEYVDLYGGNIKGDLTDSEVVVANGENNIRSYPTFTFDGTRLSLLGTNEATALGSGGVLLVNGGGSILGSLWIGSGLDVNLNRITNVDTPIEPFDAVNKEYVDQLDVFGLFTSEFDYKVPIDNNVTTSTEIPEIYYTNDIHRAFYSYAYVFQNTDNYAVYSIMGVYSPSAGWTLTQWRIGVNVDLQFSIGTNENRGTLQYINPALTGLASIRYKTAITIKTTPDTLQTEISLQASPIGYIDIPQVTFLNADMCGFTSYIYTLDTNNKATFTIIIGVLQGTNWSFHSRCVSSPNPSDSIAFDIRSTGTTGVLTYKSNLAQWMKISTQKVSRGNSVYILESNTISYTNIDDDNITDPKPLFTFGKDGLKTKFITLYITVPELDLFTMYTITAFLDYDRWVLSSQFIGDNIPEIEFRMSNVSGIGILQFVNRLQYDAHLQFSSDVSAPVFTPLPVPKGGTGVRELLPYAVLRGNGTDPIIGTEDLIYKDYTLQLGTSSKISILNTASATSLTDGNAALSVSGGAAIGGDLYLGGTVYMDAKQIKGVLNPTDPQDAVTKDYADRLDVFGILGKETIPLNEYEITRSLESNVPVPFSITDISYNSETVRAFYSYVFVYQDTDRYAIFSLFGLYEPLGGWTLTQSHVGQDVDVQFYISSSGTIQYTNTSLSGVSYIRFKTGIQIATQTALPQRELSLLATTAFIPTGIEFLDTSTLAFTMYIYTLNSDNRAAFHIINGMKDFATGEWKLFSKKVNNLEDIEFRLVTTPSGAQLEYRSTKDILIAFRQKEIVNDLNYYTLIQNTLTPTQPLTNPTPFKPVPEPVFSFGGDGVKNRFITIYVEVPDENRSALYFITALFDYDRWVLSSSFIGDYIPQIEFSIRSEGNLGWLEYTNEFNTDARIRYFYDIITPVFNPLTVDKGGTGNRELLPFAVLRGSGTSPIVATEDFVYRDFTLRLGKLSRILLTNSTDSTGPTTGTLISYGGIGIAKSAYIGDSLVVNGVDMTPSEEDISHERAFMAGNGVLSPQPINGLQFSRLKTRSFMGILSVHLNTSSGNSYAQYTLNGLARDTDWLFTASLLGDPLLSLSINSDGQIMYTCDTAPGWNYTKVKFRIMTTTV